MPSWTISYKKVENTESRLYSGSSPVVLGHFFQSFSYFYWTIVAEEWMLVWSNIHSPGTCYQSVLHCRADSSLLQCILCIPVSYRTAETQVLWEVITFSLVACHIPVCWRWCVHVQYSWIFPRTISLQSFNIHSHVQCSNYGRGELGAWLPKRKVAPLIAWFWRVQGTPSKAPSKVTICAAQYMLCKTGTVIYMHNNMPCLWSVQWLVCRLRNTDAKWKHNSKTQYHDINSIIDWFYWTN